MRTRITKKPKLNDPVLIACWPGIGNVGVIAINSLRRQTGATEMGYIEPWDFFYPNKVTIEQGQLTSLEFPRSTFYYAKKGKGDILFFLAGEQPADGFSPYGKGTKAYQMAGMVLDVAEKFGCRRVYTSGAAVTQVHHSAKPQVWAVPNEQHMLGQFRDLSNTVIMSDIKDRVDDVRITGMNGIMLGVAKTRGLDGVCLMGEVPVYLQGLPFAYPRASKSVIEVLSTVLDVDADYTRLNRLIARTEKEIDRLYKHLPEATKRLIDKLAQSTEPADTGPITENDKKQILDEIDRFFKKESKDD